MLSDADIRSAMAFGYIKLDPQPLDEDIQPASIDVHLGSIFGRLKSTVATATRLTSPSQVVYHTADSLFLKPKEFALGQLAERLTLDENHVARIEGKSSNGRKGLAIHVTAGFVDPGWDGILTLELFNASDVPYILRAGDPIGQLAFDRLSSPALRPYGHEQLGSHYQGSTQVLA